MIARVVVTPKAVVNDPQGVTVKQALAALGFDEVQDVRVGKYIEVRLDAEGDAGEARVDQMCRKLFANHVIEDFRYTLDPGPLPADGDETRKSDRAGDAKGESTVP